MAGDTRLSELGVPRRHTSGTLIPAALWAKTRCAVGVKNARALLGTGGIEPWKCGCSAGPA